MNIFSIMFVFYFIAICNFEEILKINYMLRMEVILDN
jgi:hypothetical protein